jgi:hypothetical protein
MGKCFKTEIRVEFQKLFEVVLDMACIAIPTDTQYKNFRAKVLREGNDSIRRLEAYIDTYHMREEEVEKAIETLEENLEILNGHSR